jgi:AcrR family transcriptional regulator
MAATELRRTRPRNVASGPAPAASGSKGERTKANLKRATLGVLAQRGFHDTRVSDICTAAGVSQGVFYIYFDDKVQAAREVLADFINEHFAQVFAGPHQEDAFDAILAANRRYAEIFKQNGRLSRALGETLYAIPELRELWEQGTAQFSQRIAQAVARRCPRSRPHEKARLLAAHALQGMLDAIVLGYFAWEDPLLRHVVKSPDELTESLSILWHRAMYGSDPRRTKLKHAKSMLSLKLRAPRARVVR